MWNKKQKRKAISALTYLEIQAKLNILVESSMREEKTCNRLQNHNPGLLLQAPSMAARQNGLNDLAAVIKTLAFNSAKAKNIRKWIIKPVQHPVRSTAKGALALILDNELTKDQYCMIQKDAMNRRAI